MDEKDLTTLFRSAPGDPPASGFTLTDVTKASARATKRRRSALLAVAACVVVLLGAAGVAAATYFGGSETHNAQQPVLAPAAPHGPRAESTSGCDTVDQGLATALAAELPASGAPAPGRVCTPDARSAGFHVTDGGRSGFVSVTVFPSSFALNPFDDGTVLAEQRTASGGSLVVLSTPDAGSAPPLESQLARIAHALAGRF
ncbi:MAG TPA: hypothetical protein VHC18_23065 [Amycolatopsis sp.]|nr:hypothetical protein [Amycolatopsis sp.]